MNIILFGLIAGQAAYYFISGKHQTNTDGWNILVGIQFFAGLAAMIWGWRRFKRSKGTEAA
ncbi:MAG: hypothetical protein NTV54_09520 [Ignavibacteriales bacterium]|nr:hypothetical protein [Ignavibacteriales bacterium]